MSSSSRGTRRAFLRDAVAAPAVFGASIAIAEGPRVRPHVRYGLSTASWRTVVPPGRPLPISRILDEAATAGFNGIRLTDYPSILDANGLSEDQFADELKRRGLSFSTISFGGPYHSRAKQPEVLARLRRVLALHRRLGATVAVFFPPGAVAKQDEPAVLAETCRFANTMGKLALDEFGIRLGLHNHTDSLIENQAQVDFFLEHTDPCLVFCAWDTAHLLLGGCDVIATFRKSIDRIIYTDFKDATRHPSPADYVAPNGVRYRGDSKEGRFYNAMLELGRGEIDFTALMHMLKEKSFEGWITHDLDTIRVSCPESWRVAMAYITTTLDPIYQ